MMVKSTYNFRFTINELEIMMKDEKSINVVTITDQNLCNVSI